MTEAEQPITAEEFSHRLGELLERADRNGLAFDRSWTIPADSETDLMVEITRVQSRSR